MSKQLTLSFDMARTFLSYEDLRRTGVLTSEARALQYCLDVELLRPNHFCPECQTYMELRSCASTKYSDGYCWSCPAAVSTTSLSEQEASSTTATLPLSTSSTYFGSSSTVPAYNISLRLRCVKRKKNVPCKTFSKVKLLYFCYTL